MLPHGFLQLDKYIFQAMLFKYGILSKQKCMGIDCSDMDQSYLVSQGFKN